MSTRLRSHESIRRTRMRTVLKVHSIRFTFAYDKFFSRQRCDLRFALNSFKSRQRRLTLVSLARKSVFDLTSTPFYSQIPNKPITTCPSHPPQSPTSNPPPPHISPSSSPAPTQLIVSIPPSLHPPPRHRPRKNSSPPNSGHPGHQRKPSPQASPAASPISPT